MRKGVREWLTGHRPIEKCLMSHRMLWTATLVLFFAVGLVATQDKVQIAVGLVAKVGETMLVVDVGGGVAVIHHERDHDLQGPARPRRFL